MYVCNIEHKEEGGDKLIKKRYIVVALAASSVLLSSLLYTTLVLAGKPQPLVCKDAAEIDVFGWATRQYTYDSGYPKEQGIYVHGDYPADLSFIFLPKQNLVNITEIVIVLYATGAIDLILTINGGNYNVGYISFVGPDHVSVKRIQLDPSPVQLNEGINLLSLSGSSGYLSLFKLSLLIEYEYQAG